MFGKRFKERARSDPWISDRIRRYFSRRFTVGTNAPAPQQSDTRTHIVQELFDTEVSYVDSLQTIVKKYMIPLKGSEHSAEIEGSQVDQIFCQVPEILKFHDTFLETLRSRIGYWDTKQKIGDVFIDVFTQSAVVETYIEFINNWKDARDAIKAISLAKPAFAKFLEHTSREHKGKLTLDALLIMPVQRIPRYELLIKELLKHTPMDHPDYKLLLQAQKEVHDLAVNINRVEREAMLHEQRIQKLKEVEQLIDGVVDLSKGDRHFIRHDFILIPGGLGLKKERCVFLFSDMLLITSVKKKGAIRKSSLAVTASVCGSLESNKYKLLMKTSLHNVDMIKTDDDEPCARTFLKEVTNLENDIVMLRKILELVGTIIYEHQILEDNIKDLLATITKHLAEKQASCSHLMSVELSVTINDEVENMILIFANPEQRMMWQAAFLDAKDKLDNTSENTVHPEFLCSLPLRRTRAGLQITCAAAVVDDCQSGLPDLWICSSDGYVGQVCVLTFQNEPVIASAVNVCNARILCITAIPGVSSGSLLVRRRSTLLPHLPGFKYAKLVKGDNELGRTRSFPLDSDSDDDFIDAAEEEFANEDANTLQPTMWLGTEDGCIYVFNCTDIRLQRPKLRMQHSTCIYDIIHIDEKVFVSLANGEIIIYSRDHSGLWNTSSPHRIQIATNVAPISKMILVEDKLWCSTLNSIAIINTDSLELEYTFQVASELMRHITATVLCGQGVWVTVQSSPVIHLFHATSYEHLLEINISTPVTKMLSGYGEIIRQHKLACLRVSSICIEKNLLWIGTSAGVVLNFAVPRIDSSTTVLDFVPNITGMAHGHFGHVRFLTSIYATPALDTSVPEEMNQMADFSKPGSSKEDSTPAVSYSALVIGGGDGYEDFGNLIADTAGRDDSTNHLLMWRV
ncbi:hypothetical protein JTE90_005182 [Oedothorax gibbosus]|uniref:DH domain-containing protein n=1 Tax=Oedothorax gibbosus TaxID=931172 RepID=A0AAV6UID1_9ARAC|nr:hypothetical protein JTE90_005182 [Oedothorax gibbosus]